MKRMMAGAIAIAGVGTVLALTGASEQASPKAYMIAELTVTDAEAFKTYAPKVQATLDPFGGRYLARGGKLTVLEGKSPGDRVVVIEFPSVEKAKAFYDSPAYKTIAPLRHAAAHGPAFIVEGVAP